MKPRDFLFNFEDANGLFIVRKIYVDIAGDLIAGMLLSQILYYYKPSNKPSKYEDKLRVEKDGEFWLAKQRTDWWEELRISPKQYDTAIKKLKDLGLVETKVYRFDCITTVHIKLDCDELAIRVMTLLTKGEFCFSPLGNSGLPVLDKALTPTTNIDYEQESKALANAKAGNKNQEQNKIGKEKQTQQQETNGVGNMGNLATALSKHAEKKEVALASLPTATKSSDVALRWKQHLKAKDGLGVLTAKEAGQLAHIFKKAPKDAIRIVDYVHVHWDKFLLSVNQECGTTYKALSPVIGIAVKHYDIARQLIAAVDAKKNVPKIQPIIDKQSQVVETTPKEELASAAQVAASLALFSKMEND